MKRILLIIGILWLTVAIVAQSNTCSEIVFNAIDQTSILCQDVGRNQICYGNQNVIASPAVEVADLVFNSPGNIELLNRIASFDVAEFDEAQSIWGIGVLRVQANLPDTTPGINVTVLVFGDVEATPMINDGHMQAFALSTGIGPVRCNELPDSGILIQTPNGVSTVEFTINGVQVALGSTLLIRSDEQMQVAVLEGQAVVNHVGVSQTVLAGNMTTLPVNPDGMITSLPTAPQRYTADFIRGLPLELLPREFEVVEGVQPQTAPPAIDGCNYVVQAGDTLFQIAVRSGSTVEELSQINQIDDPTRIFVGQNLTLPACIAPPVVATQPTIPTADVPNIIVPTLVVQPIATLVIVPDLKIVPTSTPEPAR